MQRRYIELLTIHKTFTGNCLLTSTHPRGKWTHYYKYLIILVSLEKKKPGNYCTTWFESWRWVWSMLHLNEVVKKKLRVPLPGPPYRQPKRRAQGWINRPNSPPIETKLYWNKEDIYMSIMSSSQFWVGGLQNLPKTLSCTNQRDVKV